ncbi:MAG: NAD(P)H-hydrate dehydratase [Oscillospiraceae bacterium]|jgi:NAD(P)H-hydrate epimerase|nr:NAD(P)H-hydrate dehydratase [Oscillospiraceae bacterium]
MKFLPYRLPKRTADSHKYSYGHLLLAAGSLRFPGAAVLAAGAAVRSGAGLVTLAFPDTAYAAIAPQSPLTPLLPLPSEASGTFAPEALPLLLEAAAGKSAALLGPGLGQSDGTRNLVPAFVQGAELPLVLDADALNCLAAHKDILQERKHPTVLTPHGGEMARLCGSSAEEIHRSRAAAAETLAAETGAVVVLKGPQTIVCYAGRQYVNTTGNDGLAKGGSGDVLAGLLAGFLTQGMEPFAAACDAVYLHGVAGVRASMRLGKRGMTPLDLLSALQGVLLQQL